MEDFDYVVKREERAEICFGMKGSRECLPERPGKMNGFMARITKQANPKIGPFSYSTEIRGALYELQHKPISKRGFGGPMRTAPIRVTKQSKLPGPANYNTMQPRKFATCKRPFDNGSERMVQKADTSVGPGNYEITKPPVGLEFMETFGGPRFMKEAVECKCCSFNTDVCRVCNQLLSWDYFRHVSKPNVFICVSCMRTEAFEHTVFTDGELKQFKVYRDCSFKHRHDGAVAAIKLLTKEQIKKKMRREAYFKQFFP